MKTKFGVVLTLLVLIVSAAVAHGDKKHVIGTLEKVNADSVVVKTADGKSVEVNLGPSTVYVTKDGKPAKLTDLAVGERVVIHATPKGETLVADEVRFGAATASSSAAKP
jgi:copper chaperone CopZ